EERLLLAARRARMIARGIEIERTTSTPLGLPDGRYEIDWDIETSSADRIYLWGFLVRDRSNPDDEGSYHGFVSFTDQGTDDEVALARRAMAWLHQQLVDHPDARVYHYSDYEMVHLAKLATQSNDETLKSTLELLRQRHLDLFETVRQNYFGAHGLSLKVVANAAAGFTWRDDTPGGLNSQAWFVEATQGPDEQTRRDARQRILDYNEDDVRATMVLRDWLRTED
ncbi:MAG: TM0106 family RecB-like putative nuclease, partial [Brooklawnia sp.]